MITVISNYKLLPVIGLHWKYTTGLVLAQYSLPETMLLKKSKCNFPYLF